MGPEEVSAGSKRRVWWHCAAGHEWQATVESRALRGHGCPYCAGKRAAPETSLAATHPALAAEWHPSRNGVLRPEDVRAGSARKVWWRCSRTPRHLWQAQILARALAGTGCPRCAALRRRRSAPARAAARHPSGGQNPGGSPTGG
jgi:hypothetical protein